MIKNVVDTLYYFSQELVYKNIKKKKTSRLDRVKQNLLMAPLI